MISAEELRVEELRQRYLELIERPDVFPTRANWEFIISHAMQGLGHHLYKKYLTAIAVDDYERHELHDVAREMFPSYLSAIDREEALEVVYGNIEANRDVAAELIRRNSLFDAEYLIGLIEDGDIDFALKVVDVYQPEYDEEDLEAMKELMERIDELPHTGAVERRHGLFGSPEKYICPEGHTNPSDAEYCRHCGKNLRGLNKEQEDAVGVFAKRVAALRRLI